MKYPMFAIRDSKVGFLPPTCDQSEQSAIRNFAYAINSDGVMHFSPKDFDLFKVGEFDAEKGSITSCLPVNICDGLSVYGVNDK